MIEASLGGASDGTSQDKGQGSSGVKGLVHKRVRLTSGIV